MQNVGEVEVQPVQILVGVEAEALQRGWNARAVAVDTASTQDSCLQSKLGFNWEESVASLCR